MSSNTGGEGEIRKNIVEADIVDCMVALPSQLFYNTPISACLWFVSRDKKNQKIRNRSRETLFIDARKLGVMIDRRHRKLTYDDIKRITDIYHSWKGKGKEEYKDIAGFCKSVTVEDIRKHNYILTPGRYVGVEEEEEDGEPFDEKMKSLLSELTNQFKKSNELQKEIEVHLGEIGYEL